MNGRLGLTDDKRRGRPKRAQRRRDEEGLEEKVLKSGNGPR